MIVGGSCELVSDGDSCGVGGNVVAVFLGKHRDGTEGNEGNEGNERVEDRRNELLPVGN